MIISNITMIIISLWTNGVLLMFLMIFLLFKCLISLPTITRRVDGLLAVTIFGRLYWINDDLLRLILKRCWLYLLSIRKIRLSCRRVVREEQICGSRRFCGRLVNLPAHKSPGHDGQLCLNRRIPLRVELRARQFHGKVKSLVSENRSDSALYLFDMEE